MRSLNDFSPSPIADPYSRGRALCGRWALFLALAILAACARTSNPGALDATRSTRSTIAPEQSRLDRLEARVAANPRSAADRVWLAQLYLARARERDRFEDFERAESLAQTAMTLAPTYGPARLARISALQAQHRFSEALALATEGFQEQREDRHLLAAIVDCLIELGRYTEVQSRLDELVALDGSPAVLARVARWHELSGRPDLAIATLEDALEGAQKSGEDADRRAWYGWRLASLHFANGANASAEAALSEALGVSPRDPACLARLADVLAAQGRFDEAVDLYRKSIEFQEAPPVVWRLGELWEARGDRTRARVWYARAEVLIREEAATSAGDAHRREAARFLADRRSDTGHAVDKARADVAERNDIYSWDTLAWALYADGQFREARDASRQALRLGTRDAWLHYHAGVIAIADGDPEAGRRHLEQALAIQPDFSPLHSARARARLAS